MARRSDAFRNQPWQRSGQPHPTPHFARRYLQLSCTQQIIRHLILKRRSPDWCIISLTLPSRAGISSEGAALWEVKVRIASFAACFEKALSLGDTSLPPGVGSDVACVRGQQFAIGVAKHTGGLQITVTAQALLLTDTRSAQACPTFESLRPLPVFLFTINASIWLSSRCGLISIV